ncbi:formiminotetrahydrofolate cyclodeaminase [Kushneria sinocarnis]|uniref:Formiminotetrahydrofolate cyclodeaminase n=1 Tax=Kushneria sinocarnis TaxID=595502 RepID=A0A420WSQ8_9GAMM|nr:cyclodeaminase/cyclohydrolase family protein [Kushneria sinocarnis]RKQ95719.1 formiminotetrahydrofolate cyclodeaminase [Kushneria sinocarnis]
MTTSRDDAGNGEQSLWQQPLHAFRQHTATQATPGCGAAATVSAEFGLALVLKGLRITQQHGDNERRAALIEWGEQLSAQLAPCADDDVAAFEQFMAATRQPQESEAERESRQQAINAAAERATAIPLRAAECCLEALTLIEEALPLSDDMLGSDARAGALMLHSALSALLLNIDADLPGLRDSRQRARAARQRRDLQRDADTLMVRLGLPGGSTFDSTTRGYSRRRPPSPSRS